MTRTIAWRAASAITLAALALSPALADEGLWLFNNPPAKILKQRYGFEPTREWLEHLQKASVRFNIGGSGSFVSPEGLVVTNHHVATPCIQKLSGAGKDYISTGFHARNRSEELRCTDEELNVLVDIEDVTARVDSAVKKGMSAADAERARRAVINTIEKESQDRTGLRSEVVTLYNGGQYHLYRFKKYTDVRLVFAPEKSIAFFGGDPDNFEYPRFNLDVTFFRVYENGRPARTKDYLRWSRGGAKDGDLVFVSGHPGRTDRLNTISHLKFLRDTANPFVLDVIRRREIVLRTYSDRSLENARQAQDELMLYQNSRKARLGMLAGLQDPSLMKRKQAEQDSLQSAVLKDPKLKDAYGGAWQEVDAAIASWKPIYSQHYLLERGAAFNAELFTIARTLVRLAEETARPNPQRLREYADSNLDSLKQQLFSEAPIYPGLEIAKLTDSLSMLAELFGADHTLVTQVLAGRSPQERATELVRGSRLADVSVRKKLAEGGVSAVQASNDPMIQLARLVDPPAREVRKLTDEKVNEPLRQAYGKLANARFSVYGSEVYPDATFTLRLSFGRVKGYAEQGRQIPWATSIGGTYEHAELHGHREPFALPKSWTEAKSRLAMNTPFNFVSTADIIGGNSGSPVVSRDGEFVGIIFDGNMQSLVWDYMYTEEQGRAVSVHSAGILEALRKVYGAGELVAELDRPAPAIRVLPSGDGNGQRR
jgi:hypothetical protein